MRLLLRFVIICALGYAGAFAQEPKSTFLTTKDGTHIHYLEQGAGRPIVFIPGWRMPAWIWQKQIDGLSKRYHVIAVDPRSQGESDKTMGGSLPEARARDYKELVDQLHLREPVMVGWSMGCGELLSYVDQFGEDNIAGLVLVDGLIPSKANPAVVSVLAQWTKNLQQDREKEADVFARAMFAKPQPEEYIQRVKQATLQVPTDSAVALIYNMVSVSDFSSSFARIHRPLLFAYEPVLQPNADYIKLHLGEKVQVVRFDGDGHALFVDDPDRFNNMIDSFMQKLPQK